MCRTWSWLTGCPDFEDGVFVCNYVIGGSVMLFGRSRALKIGCG